MKDFQRVSKFALARGFTEGQVRAWIAQAVDNGMAKAGVVVRIGRSVFLDCDKFDTWVQSKNRRPK